MRFPAENVALSLERDLASNEVTIRVAAQRRAKMRSELEAMTRQGNTIRWQEDKRWFVSWFTMTGPYFLIDHVIEQVYPERLQEVCERTENRSETQRPKAV